MIGKIYRFFLFKLHPSYRKVLKSFTNQYPVKVNDIHLQCLQLVQGFFKDTNKTRMWLMIENPNLGGIRPVHMLVLGREEKLLQFIEGARKGY